jgi:transketolase
MTDQMTPDQLCINTIRTLSIDAIQKANSGHPGTPMDAAPTVYCLWQRFLRYDPQDPDWPNRDRFVLSNGHASAMLYSLIFLAGIKAANPSYEQVGRPAVTLDDLKAFREAGSRCPGHPEYGWTSGVESTTGPLGQGVATSVGMAIAERWLAATYNRPGFDLFDYRVYALCGDGCVMEGVASEAASLAAHLKLSKLCWIYDNNHVTIEGHTRLAFTEDVASRFLGYGWHVTRVSDANDLEMLTRAYESAQNTTDRPTLIIVESHIGYGASHKQDTGTRTPNSWCRTASRPTSRLTSVGAALTYTRPGTPCSRRTAGNTRTSPTRSTACKAVSSLSAGIMTCRPSHPTPRAWPVVTPRVRRSTPSPRACRGYSVGPRIWHPQPVPT